MCVCRCVSARVCVHMCMYMWSAVCGMCVVCGVCGMCGVCGVCGVRGVCGVCGVRGVCVRYVRGVCMHVRTCMIAENTHER